VVRGGGTKPKRICEGLMQVNTKRLQNLWPSYAFC
jgi:hypothetical protein